MKAANAHERMVAAVKAGSLPIALSQFLSTEQGAWNDASLRQVLTLLLRLDHLFVKDVKLSSLAELAHRKNGMAKVRQPLHPENGSLTP